MNMAEQKKKQKKQGAGNQPKTKNMRGWEVDHRSVEVLIFHKSGDPANAIGHVGVVPITAPIGDKVMSESKEDAIARYMAKYRGKGFQVKIAPEKPRLASLF
jgi:hypothetical protein